jgi:hypothetical protein
MGRARAVNYAHVTDVEVHGRFRNRILSAWWRGSETERHRERHRETQRERQTDLQNSRKAGAYTSFPDVVPTLSNCLLNQQ